MDGQIDGNTGTGRAQGWTERAQGHGWNERIGTQLGRTGYTNNQTGQMNEQPNKQSKDGLTQVNQGK